MGNYDFSNPGVLYLLLLLIPALVWYVLRQKDQNASLQLSNTQGISDFGNTWKTHFRHLPIALKSLAFICLIIAIARPQSSESWENSTTEGIDIVIAIDVSSSMLARDFTPDRITAAKSIGAQFISGRPNDRIGLVIFSGESFTQCPLTTDHGLVVLNICLGLMDGQKLQYFYFVFLALPLFFHVLGTVLFLKESDFGDL